MANRWTIEDNAPPKGEKYEWHSPGNENQHVEQTVTPGSLRVKPKDISLVPTLAPKRSGIQHGWNNWNNQVEIAGGQWYLFGDIVQEDD